MESWKFEAIGTAWEIETPVPVPPAVRTLIADRVEDFDATFSRFRAHSLVSEMAAAERGGFFQFPEEGTKLFSLYDQLFDATDGAVDPLVGRDLELLGYDAAYSLRPDPEGIAEYAGRRMRWRKDIQREGAAVEISGPVVLDVGAAGKGLLVDLLANIMRDEAICEATVDGGGDIIHFGGEALAVGLEHPCEAGAIVGVVPLVNAALCASAVNRRAWRDVHHVVDGRTGAPARDVGATWAMCKDAMTADGLATALFFAPACRLSRWFEFSSVRMFADGRAEISPDFPGDVFTDVRNNRIDEIENSLRSHDVRGLVDVGG